MVFSNIYRRFSCRCRVGHICINWLKEVFSKQVYALACLFVSKGLAYFLFIEYETLNF